jgi:hypothetical protein
MLLALLWIVSLSIAQEPKQKPIDDAEAERIVSEMYLFMYGETREQFEERAKKIRTEYQERYQAFENRMRNSDYLTRTMLESINETKPLRVLQSLDNKTGILTVSIMSLSEKEMFLHLNTAFPPKPQFGYFWSVDYEPETGESDKSIKEKESLVNKANGRIYQGITGAKPAVKERFVILERGESFSKEFYIWDVCEWDKLLELLSKDRKLKLKFTKSASVIIGNECRIASGETIITYAIMLQMEKLRKEAEKNKPTTRHQPVKTDAE